MAIFLISLSAFCSHTRTLKKVKPLNVRVRVQYNFLCYSYNYNTDITFFCQVTIYTTIKSSCKECEKQGIKTEKEKKRRRTGGFEDMTLFGGFISGGI